MAVIINRKRRIINGQHTVYHYAADSNRLLGMAIQPLAWHPPLGASQIGQTQTNPHEPPSIDRPVKHNARGDIETLANLRIEYNANGQPERY